MPYLISSPSRSSGESCTGDSSQAVGYSRRDAPKAEKSTEGSVIELPQDQQPVNNPKTKLNPAVLLPGQRAGKTTRQWRLHRRKIFYFYFRLRWWACYLHRLGLLITITITITTIMIIVQSL